MAESPNDPMTMSIRAPYFAGTFYPGERGSLERMIRDCLPSVERKSALAAVVPHAGYIYSGKVAGGVYARLDVPRDVVLLCFHHRGLGSSFAAWSGGPWQTPLGQVEVAEDLLAAIPGTEPDEAGHRNEHSGEVQIPFLQAVRPDVRVAPVALSGGLASYEGLREFGRNLGSLDREFLVIASTDLNHYEPHDLTLVKDQYVIDAIAALDEDALRRALIDQNVSMCGYAPTIATLCYAKARGARKAELIDHKTSHDAGGEKDRTVGYCGLIVWQCSN